MGSHRTEKERAAKGVWYVELQRTKRMLRIWGLPLGPCGLARHLSTGTSTGTDVGAHHTRLSWNDGVVLLFVKTLHISRSESMETSPNMVNTLIWKVSPLTPAVHLRLVGVKKTEKYYKTCWEVYAA